MHARKCSFKALESDQQHMGSGLASDRAFDAVEERARDFTAGERLVLRQRLLARAVEKLGGYQRGSGESCCRRVLGRGRRVTR